MPLTLAVNWLTFTKVREGEGETRDEDKTVPLTCAFLVVQLMCGCGSSEWVAGDSTIDASAESYCRGSSEEAL